MKIAIPVANGMLSPHFGHCEAFTIFDIDESGEVTSRRSETPPPHEPGVLPSWLKSLNVEHIIAGGMGNRAQMLFSEYGISVTAGASGTDPEQIAQAYVKGELKCGDNLCDH